jgi:hypothetical protein
MPDAGPPEAAFETTMLYVAPVSPAVKLPLCDMTMERSDAATAVILVRSEVLAGVAVPPPETVPVLVTLAEALAATLTVSVIGG